MQGFYYLFMLIGFAWLCLWVCFPGIFGRYWSPFDMRESVASPEPDAGRGRAKPALRSGQPAAAADLQHPLPQPRTAQPWRLRREQAPPSRSGRRR